MTLQGVALLDGQLRIPHRVSLLLSATALRADSRVGYLRNPNQQFSQLCNLLRSCRSLFSRSSWRKLGCAYASSMVFHGLIGSVSVSKLRFGSPMTQGSGGCLDADGSQSPPRKGQLQDLLRRGPLC